MRKIHRIAAIERGAMRRLNVNGVARPTLRAVLSVAATVGLSLVAVPAGAQTTGVTYSSLQAGNDDGCALSTGGALYCWGADNYNQLQDGGDDSTDNIPNSVDLSTTLGANTIVAYAGGNGTECVLTSASTIYCWGYGGFGQLGDDSTDNDTGAPVEVRFTGAYSGTLISLVGGGDQSFCALTSAGQVWCWGDNVDGELGDGNTTDADEANQVVANGVLNGVTVSAIAGYSDVFCALDAGGDAFCWGDDADGALGDVNLYNANTGYTAYSDVPVQVTVNEGTMVRYIAPADSHSCFIDSNGTLWCWGANTDGIDGLGDTTNQVTPAEVPSVSSVEFHSITSSDTESCATSTSYVLYCWGDEPVGDGYFNGFQESPEIISGGDISGQSVSEVSATNYGTCALDSYGSVYCWGNNGLGQVGDDTDQETVVSSEVIAISPSEPPYEVAPNAPLNAAATPHPTTIDVSWDPPNDDGGSSITGYTAQATLGDSTFTCAGVDTDDQWGCSITGLTVGDTYEVSVYATNINGNGIATQVGQITTPDVPNQPTITKIAVTADTITVTWTPVSGNGSSVLAYTATASTESTSLECTAPSTATSCTITGVVEGTTYTVSVTATNGNGTSEASPTMSATPGTVPDPPRSPAGTAEPAAIKVTWTAPDNDGGSPLTGYKATATHGTTSKNCTAEPAATMCTITGLTDGTSYAVSVIASNQAGSSTAASAGNVTPVSVPGAPDLKSVTPSNGAIAATWVASSNTGGETVTGFTATAQSGAFTNTCTAGATDTGCSITGLTNGLLYTVTVVAANGIGPSNASNALTATPATIPATPTITSVAIGNGSVTVSWTPPDSNGGSPIKEYLVLAEPSGQCATGYLGTSCTIKKLTPNVPYTLAVYAVNALGDSSPATTPAVYPFVAHPFGVESTITILYPSQLFQAVVSGGTPGVTASFKMTNAPTETCTLNSFKQCHVNFHQPKSGIYKITVHEGIDSETTTVYVPIVQPPKTVKVDKTLTVKVVDGPPDGLVVMKVNGKTLTGRVNAAGLCQITTTIKVKGIYPLTTTLNGVSIGGTIKLKVT